MADHFHSGEITTLHRLATPGDGHLESVLLDYARRKSICLLLPCHSRDLRGGGMQGIAKVLGDIHYLSDIVIGLDSASAEDEAFARSLLHSIPARIHILRHPASQQGKGANIRSCLDFLQSHCQPGLIALHDCDILTYDRELLARLLFPLACPDFSYGFAKGYYARFSTCLHARLTRLFLFPLLEALAALFPQSAGLEFLRSFRYPLAGECAMTDEVARRLDFPSGWGVDIGLLTSVRQVLPAAQICQVELCGRYDHKHSPVESGLALTGVEVAQAILNFLQGEGLVISLSELRPRLEISIRRALRKSAADARINGLEWREDEEKHAAEYFAQSFCEAHSDMEA